MEVLAPGMKKEDFILNVAGDILTVSFEHKEANSQENRKESWLRREFTNGSFRRSFIFDDTVDAGKITAQYLEGVLHLSLPKKEQAQKISRNIEIH